MLLVILDLQTSSIDFLETTNALWRTSLIELGKNSITRSFLSRLSDCKNRIQNSSSSTIFGNACEMLRWSRKVVGFIALFEMGCFLASHEVKEGLKLVPGLTTWGLRFRIFRPVPRVQLTTLPQPPPGSHGGQQNKSQKLILAPSSALTSAAEPSK